MILVCRTDASVAIGTGHVMRCLALAQAWQDAGGQAIFAIAEATAAVRERLQQQGFQILSVEAAPGSLEDARSLSALAKDAAAGWLVVDGYCFDDEYQRALKREGFKILFIDDYGNARHYAADFILNQNAAAQESDYPNRESCTRLLLGARYALLRREFVAESARPREIPPVARRVLITMGGSDPQNFAECAMRAFARVNIEGAEAIVVAGGSNPHTESLERTAAELGGKLRVKNNVSNMAELMSWADVAVSGAGSTSWELCRMGLPALTVDVAQNQRSLARELDRRGCTIHLGSADSVSEQVIADRLQWLMNSEEKRQSLWQRGRELVDGKGARRVAAALLSGNLRLRRAVEGDCRLLWEWANDPDVRAASFSPGKIPWDTHVAWFEDKLRQDGSIILVAERDGIPVGQIRFDKNGNREADIGISLARERRGQGIAGNLICLGVDEVFRDPRFQRINAYVKQENVSSIRAFEHAGFRRVGVTNVKGNVAVHFVYERNSRD